MCVCVRGRETVSVSERGRETVFVCESERSLCVGEREGERQFVCG